MYPSRAVSIHKRRQNWKKLREVKKGKLRKINGQGMEVKNQGAARRPDNLPDEQYLFYMYL